MYIEERPNTKWKAPHGSETKFIYASAFYVRINGELVGPYRTRERAIVAYLNKSDNLCPWCNAELPERWSGIKCNKCDYWFCF